MAFETGKQSRDESGPNWEIQSSDGKAGNIAYILSCGIDISAQPVMQEKSALYALDGKFSSYLIANFPGSFL